MSGFPFAPAEPYAWPGGYPIVYVMDDGECLCAACVNDATNPVHAGGEADGWRLEGMQVNDAPEGDDDIVCAHCERSLGGRDA